MNRSRLSLSVAACAIALGGCATTNQTEFDQLQGELAEQQSKNQILESSVTNLEAKLQDQESMLADHSTMGAQSSDNSSLLPPNAKAGECYARVFVPPQYESVSRPMVTREASERVEVTNAEWGWDSQQVLVREASTELKIIPASYKWVEERVLVKEAGQELRIEPAVYREESERVLVQAAYTTWKKGRGPIERIDEATGEIMCLVEVPAQYETVSKNVLVAAAKTYTTDVPAEYKTVRKKVLVDAARTVEMQVPAEYKTVRVKKLVSEPKEVRTTIPEQTGTYTETKLVRDGNLEWRPILCETNTTPGVISKLQSSLANSGYNPGRIDGVLGGQTLAAVTRYQKANGLPSGKLTMETLRKLGVF